LCKWIEVSFYVCFILFRVKFKFVYLYCDIPIIGFCLLMPSFDIDIYYVFSDINCWFSICRSVNMKLINFIFRFIVSFLGDYRQWCWTQWYAWSDVLAFILSCNIFFSDHFFHGIMLYFNIHVSSDKLLDLKMGRCEVF